MSKNLKKALENQTLSDPEKELIDQLDTLVAGLNHISFKTLIAYAFMSIKQKITKESFNYDHPSDFYDDNGLEAIKEFLNKERYQDLGSDDEDSFSYEDKWDFLEEVRTKFKENYKEKIQTFDIIESDEIKDLYANYLKEINPNSKLSRSEFVSAILNNPIFGNINDPGGYFEYSG